MHDRAGDHLDQHESDDQRQNEHQLLPIAIAGHGPMHVHVSAVPAAASMAGLVRTHPTQRSASQRRDPACTGAWERPGGARWRRPPRRRAWD